MKYFAKMLIALIGSGMMMLIIYHMLARRYRRVCHRVPEAVKRDLKVSAYVKQVTDEQKEEIVRQQRKELVGTQREDCYLKSRTEASEVTKPTLLMSWLQTSNLNNSNFLLF